MNHMISETVTLDHHCLELVKQANRAVANLFLYAARIGDPLTASILGTNPEVLNEFTKVKPEKLQGILEKIGAPIFKIRFVSAQTVAALIKNGFDDPTVLREYMQDIPLESFTTKRTTK